jgi:hypothetical protein
LKIFAIFLQLLHKNVDSVEKKLAGSSGTLTLKCKDFQFMLLEIPTVEDCLNVASSVEQLSHIGRFAMIGAGYGQRIRGHSGFSISSKLHRPVNSIQANLGYYVGDEIPALNRHGKLS